MRLSYTSLIKSPSALAFLRSGVAFSPLFTFTASEPGIWLDPSDITTLYQDTAGMAPVTTPGQSVALALDKSKGLVLGTPFTVSSWTNSASPWDVFASTGGSFTAEKTVSGGTDLAYSNTSSFTLGAWYQITIDVTSTTLSAYTVQLSATTNSRSTVAVFSGSGIKTALIQANSSTGSFSIAVSTTALGSISIASVSIRELPGFHAAQATLASRPTYQVDGSGKAYLSFDGVDDFMVTPTITPGIDKAQVFAGVRKLSDAAAGIVAELSATVSSNAGSFYLAAPEDLSIRYSSLSRGSLSASIGMRSDVTTGSAPDTAVLAVTHDIAGDLSTIRRNGVAGTNRTGDKGTGNFLAYPLYIGRRGGTTLPFNGQLYSLIVRFGTNLDADTITSTETWINGKTGAY